MAINENNTLSTGNDQAIGQAVIVSGSVQAEAPNGSIRELQVNGKVFANDTIITGGDGKVSIILNDAAQTQLDLGRMSEVTLDEDVFPDGAAVDLAEVALEVEQMQEALLQGDPTQDLPAPAAGPAAGAIGPRGGGHPTVEFDLTGEEVTPDSGAETIGVGRDFVDPDRPLTQEVAEPVLAAVVPEPLAADGSPLAGNYENFLDEEHLVDGTNPIPELMTISGDLGDMGVNFGPDGPGGIQFGGQFLAIDNLGGGAVDSITVSGSYGNLTFYDNGTWSFNVPDNIYHPIPGATGAADSLPDVFGFTITDGNGTPASGTMTFNIYDDGPIMTGVEIDRVVEEEALDNFPFVDGPNIVGSDGNPDENDGPEDATQPDAAVVNGNLASIVTMGADNPGTFSVGILANLPGLSSQGEQVLYRMNANGTTIEAYVAGYMDDDSPGDAFFATSDFQQEGGEERIVFTLDIQPNGDYIYTLLDQLDHEDDGTDSENTALLLWGPDGPVGTVDFIDFSSAIMATDSDLDSIGFPDGIVTFTVVDDIPRLVDLREPSDNDETSSLNSIATGMAFGGVQEDALDNSTANFQNNPDGDDSQGNLEHPLATDQTSLLLRPLVEVGADENLSWSITDPDGADSGLTSDNAPVYYHLVDGVLVATTSAVAPADLAAPNIFTFSINEYSGEAIFNLNDQLDHGYAGADEEHGTADDIPAGDWGALYINNLGQYVQATDFDGDSVSLDGRIRIAVENDVPRLVPINDRPGDDDVTAAFAGLPVEDGIANMDVQEDALGRDVPDVNNPDNNNDGDNSIGNVDSLSDTDQAGYDLSALVETGADEELSWSLIPKDGPYQSSLKSGGETVFYEIDGNSLNASTASVDSIFTFTVDANSGEAVFNLNDQIDHPDGAGDDYELTIDDLGQFVRATDTDGDYVDLTGRIRVDVENDIPETGTPQFAILANEEGNNLVADLAIEIGADEPGSEMSLNPIYNGVMAEEGDVVRNNNGEVMTYDGEELVWQQNSNGSWSAVVTGESEEDDDDSSSRSIDSDSAPAMSIVVFTVALEEDAGEYTGNYTVELHKELDGGEGSGEEFSLDFTRGGGHATERVFEEGDVTITVTAVDPDHLDPDFVNWSSQGMGVGNAFINEDMNQGRDGDEHGSEILVFNFTDSDSGDALPLNTASFGLDHLSENGDTPEVAIWTAYGYEADGVTETVVGSGEVTGELLGSAWKSDQEVTIDESNTTGGFYRVEFWAEHTANDQGYRVTQLEGSSGEESEGLDQTVSFVVDGKDSDGDAFDQQAFDVTFDGDGDIVGTDADEVIVGSSEDDVIDGGGGNDVIFGGEGDDEIDGGEGNDILLGGAGDDTITGDAGADTFDIVEEGAGEVQDYAPDAPPTGDGDELDDLVPPVIEGTV